LDKTQEGSSGDSGNEPKDKKNPKWGQNTSKMLIPPDADYNVNNSSFNVNNSSVGSSGTIAQEMIDLVDNLIDASPNSRADKYEKSGGLSILLKPTRNSNASSPLFEQNKVNTSTKSGDTSFNVESMISSVGILKYGSGNIYEGQLLNGKRSGKGMMTFVNGDKYVGMWKVDQMCDHEGIYSYKNGNEYRGSFKTCSKYCSSKYGMIDGPGTLKMSGIGTFTGNFKDGEIHGPGRMEFLDPKMKPLEENFEHVSITEFVKSYDFILEKEY